MSILRTGLNSYFSFLFILIIEKKLGKARLIKRYDPNVLSGVDEKYFLLLSRVTYKSIRRVIFLCH